jgi:hypothetical protein
MQMETHIAMLEERHVYEKAQLTGRCEAAEEEIERLKRTSDEKVGILNARIASLT